MIGTWPPSGTVDTVSEVYPIASTNFVERATFRLRLRLRLHIERTLILPSEDATTRIIGQEALLCSHEVQRQEHCASATAYDRSGQQASELLLGGMYRHHQRLCRHR